jgi:hypothetical protein
MAHGNASGIHPARRPAQGVPLERLLAPAAWPDAISKAELELGDRVLVATRNSLYVLQSLGQDWFVASGGWFDSHADGPVQVAVNGCTWGGTAIKHDIVAAPGLFLEFGNGVKTTRIKSARLVRTECNGPGN